MTKKVIRNFRRWNGIFS